MEQTYVLLNSELVEKEMIFRKWLKNLGSQELESGEVLLIDVSRHKEIIERILTKNIIPFWYPHIPMWLIGKMGVFS